MTTSATFGKGSTLKRGDGAPVAIVEITSITGPTSSADQIDITTQDSTGNYREFINGLVDPGTISFTIFYDPTATTHQDLFDDLGSTDAPVGYQLRLGSGGANGLDFDGKVNAFEFGVPIDGAVTADITVQVSGAVTRV